MFKIDILLLFYLHHGCIITKKSASDSHLFILFPETKLFPKNIIFPIVPMQFLQFVSAKYLIVFNLTFCHLFYLQAAIISKDGINNA